MTYLILNILIIVYFTMEILKFMHIVITRRQEVLLIGGEVNMFQAVQILHYSLKLGINIL